MIFPVATNSPYDRNRLTATLFCSGLTLLFSAVFVLLRLAFPISCTTVLKTAGLGLFLINLPVALYKVKAFDSLKALIGILIAVLFGWISNRTAINLSWIFPAAGWIFFIWNSIRFFQACTFKTVLRLSPIFLLFSAWVVSWLWKSGYQNPLFLEGLSLGHGHDDTLFHASISQMIRTYGIPTTGVDGLPAMRYHFGSHWLFAQLASLIQIPLLDFYNFGFGAVCISLYFFALLMVVIEWGHLKNNVFTIGFDSRSGKIFWFLFLFCHIPFLTETFLSTIAIWNHYLISESYCVALTVLFLGLPAVLYGFLRMGRNRGLKPPQIYFFLFLPAFVVVLGLMKNSVMILFVGAVLYAFLRMACWRDPAATGSILVLVLAACWTVRMTTSPSYNASHVVWFDFIKGNVRPSRLLFFFVFYFLFSIAYSVIRFRQLNFQSWKSFKMLFQKRATLDMELLIWICTIGFLPGMLFFIPGGSAQYFSDIQTRLAIPLLLTVVPAWPTAHRIVQKRKTALFLVCACCTLWIFFTASSVKKMVKLNLNYRIEMAHSKNTPTELLKEAFSGKHPIPYLKHALMDTPVRSLHRNKYMPFLETLYGLDRESREWKSHSLIYIPQCDTLFWRSFYADHPRWKISLMVPAISGVAMIDGLPPADMQPMYHGFGYYTPRVQKETRPRDPRSLCETALTMGLRNIRLILFQPILKKPVYYMCNGNTTQTGENPCTTSKSVP